MHYRIIWTARGVIECIICETKEEQKQVQIGKRSSNHRAFCITQDFGVLFFLSIRNKTERSKITSNDTNYYTLYVFIVNVNNSYKIDITVIKRKLPASNYF